MEVGGGVEVKTYTAWGKDRTGSITKTDRQYTGQINESELGLYFYNARYYDSELGRFTSADTIVPQPGNPSSFDRYSYVNNNPIHNIDPSGHRACSGWDEYGNCIADIGWKPNSDFGVRTIVKEVKEIIPSPVSQIDNTRTFADKISEIYDSFNWSLQSPGEITYYSTPFYSFYGGYRQYFTGEVTVNHGMTTTIGNNSIQLGPLEVSPERISYEMGQCSLNSLGLIFNQNIDIPLDPWSFTFEYDITYKKGDTLLTYTFGTEYKIRPDNLMLVPVTILGGLVGIGAITSPASLSTTPALQY
jgi:RHS repeat-associated protein